MDDYCLMKDAAKAVGIIPLLAGQELDVSEFGGLAICGNGEHIVWDPMNDDDTAFRLAVNLAVSIDIWDRGDPYPAHVKVCVRVSENGNFCVFEEFGNDKFSATRRAIVRAAAEIGLRMQPISNEVMP